MSWACCLCFKFCFFFLLTTLFNQTYCDMSLHPIFIKDDKEDKDDEEDNDNDKDNDGDDED